MALVTIYDSGNVAHEVKNPSYYNGSSATIVDSARNAGGFVRGVVVRDDVGKIEMKWRYLTAAEWSAILLLFNATLGGNFYNTVRFFDQVRNDYKTCTMYVSDRTSGAYMLDVDGTVKGWTDCAISLVEV